MTASSNKPHVLMFVENASAPTDRRVWMEATSLSAAGYRLTIVSPTGRARDTTRHEWVSGIEIHRYPRREASGGPRGYLREFAHALLQMRRIARRVSSAGTVDVVHLCNPPDVLYLAVAALRRKGVPVIFDHHDLVPELFEARFGHRNGLLYKAAVLAERRTFAAADVVLSPNESYRRTAMTRGGKSPDDVFVVRMAPDAKFRPVEPDAALKSRQKYLLAYAGTMGPQDGVDYALRSLRLLADRRDDWHAVFAGEGDAAAEMRALAERLEIGDRVEFVGFLEDQELIRLLSTADVCLSPEPSNPLNDASTMIKVVEYMGMGRPTVAFDLRETRFSAGEAASYATPNDEASFAECIERLLDDVALRTRMGAIGRRRMEDELPWSRSEQQLLAAYERALRRARPAA